MDNAPACANCGHSDYHCPCSGCNHHDGQEWCDCTAWVDPSSATTEDMSAGAGEIFEDELPHVRAVTHDTDVTRC